ncbi:MAG: hypothetical protein EOM26_09220 [Alphaproteobacteria bacterium]|nr:hypothetical protein [Alphaproteobacteria bacterium]
MFARPVTLSLVLLLLQGCGTGSAPPRGEMDAVAPGLGRASASLAGSVPEQIETFSPDVSGFGKWNRMLARMHRDSTVDGVLDEGKGLFGGRLEDLRGAPLGVRLTYVNDFVNRAPYVSDAKRWGQTDYWATPTELMRNGGDCEDFAIAKYFALGEAGIPERDMRIAVVEDRMQGRPHAILIVDTPNGSVVLDNQYPTVETAERIRTVYRFIYAINRTGWWKYQL